jgi:phosphatidylinositol phospholipase C delta
MTSKILFKDIIKTIKLFMNFHPDTFPIILSFENHCSIPYQEVIAEQLVRILGDTLYIPAESSLYSILPSPWA